MKTKSSNVEEILGSKARLKIIKLLVYKTELNISSIIKKTHLNHSIVSKHLKKLKEIGLIQEKKFGRIKIYRYRKENLKAQGLKKFIEIWEEKY